MTFKTLQEKLNTAAPKDGPKTKEVANEIKKIVREFIHDPTTSLEDLQKVNRLIEESQFKN
jgi:hypothetical protein